MKVLKLSFALILAAVSVGLLANGCASLDPAGPYKGDAALYQADGAITSSYELVHAFVKWEQERRPALASTPEITYYADYCREHSKEWVRTALALRDAYATAPNGDPAALNQALAVLREAAAQAAKYLLAATAATAPVSP